MTEVLKSSSLWCRSSEPSCPSGKCSRCTSVGGSDAAPPLPEFLELLRGGNPGLQARGGSAPSRLNRPEIGHPTVSRFGTTAYRLPCDGDRSSAESGLRILRRPLAGRRSEEHTSELQSRPHLVC